MDRLAALFEQLSLPEISRVLRRTAFSAIAVGIVALGVSVLLSHPFIGLGACIGLALGIGNVRLITASVARVNATQAARPKRVLASHTLTRLLITTLIVIGLILASIQLGFGTAAGLALFYFVLLANLIRTIFKSNAVGLHT